MSCDQTNIRDAFRIVAELAMAIVADDEEMRQMSRHSMPTMDDWRYVYCVRCSYTQYVILAELDPWCPECGLLLVKSPARDGGVNRAPVPP